jgi:hypothetical protein
MLGTLRRTVFQQLLAEGQKLLLAPIGEEAGKADTGRTCAVTHAV